MSTLYHCINAEERIEFAGNVRNDIVTKGLFKVLCYGLMIVNVVTSILRYYPITTIPRGTFLSTLIAYFSLGLAISFSVCFSF